MTKVIVSEEMIKHSAFVCGPDSTFLTILEQGEAYKKAGLKPVYIFDNVLGIVEVGVEDTTYKKLLN